MMSLAKKEEQVLRQMEQHLLQTQLCLQSCRKLFDRYLDNDAAACEALWLEVQDREHQADVLRRTVYDLLSQGAFLPLLRGDLHRLVDTLDDVAGVGEDLTDKLVCEHPALPAAVVPPLQTIFDKTMNQLDEMVQAVQQFLDDHTSVSVRAHEGLQRILAMEHEIDLIEHQLTRSLFASGLSLAEKMHVKQVLSQMAEISNRIEDVVDCLAEIMIKFQA